MQRSGMVTVLNAEPYSQYNTGHTTLTKGQPGLGKVIQGNGPECKMCTQKSSMLQQLG